MNREPRAGEASEATASSERFELQLDRRLAKAALWLGGIALAIAVLTLLLYATSASLPGHPWSDLRRGSVWLFLMYLPSALGSVVLGLCVVWISRDFKGSGALAAAFGGLSLIVTLVGHAAIGA